MPLSEAEYKRIFKLEQRLAESKKKYAALDKKNNSEAWKMRKKQKEIEERILEMREKEVKVQEKSVELTHEQKSLVGDINSQYKSLDKAQRKLNITGKDFFGTKRKQLNIEKELLDTLSGVTKQETDPEKLTVLESQKDFINDIQEGMVDIAALKVKQQDLDEMINKLSPDDPMRSVLESSKKVFVAKEKQLKTDNAIEAVTSGAGELTGNMFSNFQGMSTSAGLWAAGIGLAVMALVSFDAKLQAIADEFGAIGLNSGEIRADLMEAEVEATKLGKGMEDVVITVSELTSEFGIGFDEARNMAASVIDTTTALGLSNEEGVQLIGTFKTLTGLSTEQSSNLSKQVALLANASDVAPKAVMTDIAESSVTVAKFTDASGENIARGAIQARKFGISLEDAATAADNLLDFEESITAATEASVILGRDINIQKLQELSLAGDLEALQKEQLNQLGSQSNWLKMNTIERGLLADAVGLSVDEAAKFLAHEKEAVSLAGELAGQPGFEQMVGDKGITTLTRLTSGLKSLGSLLTNTLGPILNTVLGLLIPLLKLIEFILEPINLMLRGLNTAMGGAFTMGGAAIPGLAEPSIVKPSPGGTIATIGEGGESELVSPLSKLGGGVVGGSSPELVNAINKFNEKADKLAVATEKVSKMEMKFDVINRNKLQGIMTPPVTSIA
jgi:hypothetical protein